MSNSTIYMPDAVTRYLIEHGVDEHPVMAELRTETAALPMAVMQIAPEQGQFLGMLMRLIGARRSLDIGVFTGYSALVAALAVPDDGQVVALDISEEWTAIGRRAWAAAGVADKVNLRLAPALETLDALLAEGQAGQFDFAFIDADKVNYWHYYERSLELVRSGGLIVVDNVLWSGRVVESIDTEVGDGRENEPDTQAIRAFNDRLRNDDRVDICMLPVADGLTLIRPR